MTERVVGCERDDGLLNIHPEGEACEVCDTSADPSTLRAMAERWEGRRLSLENGDFLVSILLSAVATAMEEAGEP